MKTVVPQPQFTQLTEEEILKALDAFEAEVEAYYASLPEEECSCEDPVDDSEDEDEDDLDAFESDDPVVREVERLIAGYAERFDACCREKSEVPEEALLYKPKTAIERVAFQIFTEALHDSLMDDDDE